jgi:hypothetical protein
MFPDTAGSDPRCGEHLGSGHCRFHPISISWKGEIHINRKAHPKTDVKVKLVGENGNAFYILGTVIKALRQAGYDREFIQQFQAEATAGDYDHLLQTVMEYVDIE